MITKKVSNRALNRSRCSTLYEQVLRALFFFLLLHLWGLAGKPTTFFSLMIELCALCRSTSFCHSF
jgi:hypothetical protein